MFGSPLCSRSVLVFALYLAASLTYGRSLPSGGFDPVLFKTSDHIALCFDLAVSHPPRAGLAINFPAEPEIKQHSVFLGFRSRNVDQSENAYVTSGSFSRFTLINFISSPGIPTAIGIGVTPVADEIVEGDFFRTDLPGTLYLMEAGLKRRFVYKLNSTSLLLRDSPIASLAVEQPDVVAVRLPVRAEVFESREATAVAIRTLNLTTGPVRHYVAANMSATGATLDILYQVQPTSAQQKVFEYGLKLFGVILVPLVGVVLLTSKEVNERAKLRRRILWIGGTVEFVGVSLLLWWAFRIESVAGLDALVEIVLAVIGAVATASVAFVKGSAAA